MQEEKKTSFISYLESLKARDDRGALAALRQGLGQPAGTVYQMFPYVVPWLPNDVSRSYEDAYYLVAALFAYHPEPGGSGNMGDHFARTRDPEGDDSAVERRFTALLAAHREELPTYLRQAISFLRTKEIPVDWSRLFRHIQQWDNPSGYVQREWARSFWGSAARTDQKTTE